MKRFIFMLLACISMLFSFSAPSMAMGYSDSIASPSYVLVEKQAGSVAVAAKSVVAMKNSNVLADKNIDISDKTIAYKSKSASAHNSEKHYSLERKATLSLIAAVSNRNRQSVITSVSMQLKPHGWRS